MKCLSMKILALGITGLLFTALPGCADGDKDKGPAEKAGKAIDEAVEDMREKIEDGADKDGPMEKAGEAVDDAVKDAKKKLEPDK